MRRACLIGQHINGAEHLDGGLYRLLVAAGILQNHGAVIAACLAVNGLCLPIDGVFGRILYLGKRILGLHALIVNGDTRIFCLGLRSFGVTDYQQHLAACLPVPDGENICSLLLETDIGIADIACLASVFHERAGIGSAVAELSPEENVHPAVNAEHNNRNGNSDGKHCRKGNYEPFFRLSFFLYRRSRHNADTSVHEKSFFDEYIFYHTTSCITTIFC